MKFIAYDPITKEKVRLIPHIQKVGPYKVKIYYSDEKDNYVYHLTSKQLFEVKQYKYPIEVVLASKRYYLIGEYE